jgi:hypothetical protein
MSDFVYARVFAAEDGHSDFEDVAIPFDTLMEAPPAEPAALATIGPASRVEVMRAGPDWGGEVFHAAPARQMFTVLAGARQVTTSRGVTRRFDVGQSLVVDVLTGQGHSSRALADGSLALVTVF